MTTWDVRKASLGTIEGLQHQLLQASVEHCKGLHEARGSCAAGDHGCPVRSRLVSAVWKPMRFLVPGRTGMSAGVYRLDLDGKGEAPV